MYPKNLSVKSRRRRRQLRGFGGLDRTGSAAPAALADSRGLSFDAFPYLATRRGYQPVRKTQNAGAFFAWGELCTVEGTTLYYGERAVGTVTPGRKQFAVVNTKLVVFPDKKYLDLDTMELKPLGAKGETLDHSVRFTETTLALRGKRPVLADWEYHGMSAGVDIATNNYFAVVLGEEHVVWDVRQDNGTGAWVIGGDGVQAMNIIEIREQYLAGAEVCVMIGGNGEPNPKFSTTRPNAMEVWAQSMNSAGRYALVTGGPTWEAAQSINIPLEMRYAGSGSNPGMDTLGFSPGDVVIVSGCETFPENNRAVKLTAVTDTTLTFDSPVFTPGKEVGAVTVERRIPDLDFICEGDNRLFGVNNTEGRIYASALGDPRNFDVREGLSTDSWRQDVGTAGDFTGCVAFAGSVLFWKEDCLHKLMGARPSAYQLYTCHTDGLQAGSERSMVILNDVLYYKGRGGVYAYSGSTPKLISAPLGHVSYDTAAAGGSGQVYRISMRRQDTDTWELLSYHTGHGVWLKEEERRAAGFARVAGTLYMLSEDTIYALDRGEDDAGAPISWEATLAPTTEDVPELKCPSRLLLRLELAPGAWVEAQISRDGKPFERLWTSHHVCAPTVRIPIRPGQCDRFQVRFKGEGRCVIGDLAWEFTLGGAR